MRIAATAAQQAGSAPPTANPESAANQAVRQRGAPASSGRGSPGAGRQHRALFPAAGSAGARTSSWSAPRAARHAEMRDVLGIRDLQPDRTSGIGDGLALRRRGAATGRARAAQAIAQARSARSRFVADLAAFVRFPSVSAQPRHADDLRRCAAWLADHLRSIGLEHVRVVATRGHPIVTADWLHAPDAPTRPDLRTLRRPAAGSPRRMDVAAVRAGAARRLSSWPWRRRRQGTDVRPRQGARMLAARRQARFPSM